MPDLKDFAPEDLKLEQRITEVHVLPDHPLALCTVQRIEPEADCYASSLWTFHLESGEARRFTFGQAEDKHARWSPDGREVAFLSDRVKKGTFQVYRLPSDGGEARQITEGDYDVRAATWAPDGNRICFSRTRDKDGEEHCTDIWLMNLNADGEPSGARRLSFQQANSSSPSWSPDGRWIVFSGSLDDGDAQMRLWLINVEQETVAPLGADSLEVMGELQWNRESSEVAVIQVERDLQQIAAVRIPGGEARGREFSDRLRARWGELDLPQHLAAIEQLRHEGFVDERFAITGSSYGGYLSAYAVGHSRRFRAAVVCAPVASMESHFGTSDSGSYADAYSSDGEPAQQREQLARLSPVSAIEKVRTPTLFLQGSDDERCPRGREAAPCRRGTDGAGALSGRQSPCLWTRQTVAPRRHPAANR